MKKIVLLMLAIASVAFSADAADVANQTLKSYSALGAGVCLGLAALGGAIGMGNTAAATIAGTARNPGLGKKLMTTMFIAIALVEAQVIYALVVAMIILYSNPFLS